MSTAYYNDIFYPLQDHVLLLINAADVGFYLTGGTAASRAYLQHRYSDDLDLFLNDAVDFPLQVSRCFSVLANDLTMHSDILLNEARFARAIVTRGDAVLKVELVNDVPSRIGTPAQHPVLGRIDTAENIFANKISAVIDRGEPKDLADIWGFVTQMNLSINDAIHGAQGKAAGVFPPVIAKVLLSAQREDWESVRWITAPDSESYLHALHTLGESLLMGGATDTDRR